MSAALLNYSWAAELAPALAAKMARAPRPGEQIEPSEWRALVAAGLEPGGRPVMIPHGRKAVIYIWVTEGDDRVCDECAGMEGAAVLDPNAWTVAPGMMHPHCRCITQVVYADPAAAGLTGEGGFIRQEYRPPRRNDWRVNVADHKAYISVDAAIFANPLGWQEGGEEIPMLYIRLFDAYRTGRAK